MNPSTLEIVDKIYVTSQKGSPIYRLNEIEYIQGKDGNNDYIWANIFGQDAIVKINVQTGVIEKRVNLSVLADIQMTYVKEKNPRLMGYDQFNNVLNGIAYVESEDAFYVTGKDWSFIFKIKILE